MCRHSHDRAGAVVHQHVVGDPDRNARVVDGVRGEEAGEDPGLGSRRALFGGSGAGLADVLADLVAGRGLLGQRVDEWMLRREHEEGRPEQRVGTGGEHRDVDVELLDPEEDLRAFRPADPVALHRQHAFRPVQILHLVEQVVGVGGDAEEPLLELARLDLEPATLATAVLDLLVREHGLVVRAPVDDRRLSVGLPRLEELQEEPLRPAVVLGVVRRELPRPVDRPAKSLHRPAYFFDVALDDLARMPALLDRRVLGRQPEGVVAHRAQHLGARTPVEVREDVAERVDQNVPDVQ